MKRTVSYLASVMFTFAVGVIVSAYTDLKRERIISNVPKSTNSALWEAPNLIPNYISDCQLSVIVTADRSLYLSGKRSGASSQSWGAYRAIGACVQRKG